MKLLVVALAALCLTGCNSPYQRFLGHWNGGFEPEKPAREGLAMRGYIQIYTTDARFVAEFANSSQTVTLSGVWRHVKGDELEFLPRKYSIEEPDLAKLAALGRPFIAPEALEAVYHRPFVLTLGPDRARLEGPTVRLGPMLGRHVFVRQPGMQG